MHACHRREGNRKAAQRLRQRRMETVSNLQGEIARLEQERLVYLNHIYQLAASARSVVSENKMLRTHLVALQQQGAAADLVRSLPASAAILPLLPYQAPAWLDRESRGCRSMRNRACPCMQAMVSAGQQQICRRQPARSCRGRMHWRESHGAVLLLQAPELLGMGAAASAAQALAQQHCAQSRPACSNAATSRMDFDAVRRELFTPGNASSAPVWPFQARPCHLAVLCQGRY